MKRPIGMVCLVACGLLFLALPLFADRTRFHMKNGDVITGKILVQRSAEILVDTSYGRVVLPKALIASSEKVVEKKQAPAEVRSKPAKKRPDTSIEKETLAGIQAALQAIEQAVNRGDGKSLAAALLDAPARPLDDLKALKARLGLSRVALRASTGRKLSDRVRVTVTVEQTNGAGDRQQSVSGESFGFRQARGGWKLILEQNHLAAKLDRLSAAEQAVVAQLKKIHQAQLAFRKQAAVDLDGDRKGEFGFLQELAGVALRTGKQGKRPPISPLIEPGLGRTLAKNRRHATLGGYNYLVYLPGDNRPVAETGPLPAWLPVHADRAEGYYICYAWPAEYGKSGQRAFVLYHQGQIYYTMNGGAYSGANAPAGEAAFPSNDAEDPHNLISSTLGGNPAWDALVWLKLGVPFGRPVPRGIHVIDRLLLAQSIYPDGGVRRAARKSALPAAARGSARDKESVKQAQRDVQDLVIAVRIYHTSTGRYPPSGRRNLVIYLDGDPKNGGSSTNYYIFTPERLKGSTYLDPWGNPYLYRAPSARHAEPLVWSAGPNGRDEAGGGDDVSSEKNEK